LNGRRIADGMKHAEVKEIMDRIADDYERIAELFAQGILKQK